MRRASKVDETQRAIVDTFRAAGASVWIIGLPVDLIVGKNGITALVECKRKVGKRAPKAAGYTDLQKDFMATWRGGPVATIMDTEGALALVRSMGLTGFLPDGSGEHAMNDDRLIRVQVDDVEGLARMRLLFGKEELCVVLAIDSERSQVAQALRSLADKLESMNDR